MQLEDIRAHQAKYLKKIKSKKDPYLVKVCNIDIPVWPNVFPPTTDTELFAEHIVMKAGDRVLDLTTGSGALAIIAGSQGASGLACDIHEEAVRNAEDNFAKFKVDFKVICSDLFDKVPPEQFDYIFANGPYIEGEIKEPLEYAFYGARDFITRLFKGAAKHLRPNGKILITFPEWGDLEYLKNASLENGFQQQKLGERKSSDGQRIYLLFQFSKIPG